MTVKLNIEEDAELRAAIKEAIKGQVRSIAREDIIAILKEILSSKVPEANPDTLLKEYIVKLAKDQLDDGTWSKPSYIKQVAREEIQKIVKELMTKNPIV